MPNPILYRRILATQRTNYITNFTLPANPFSLYSLRQYSGYGGLCCEVRRDSDDTTIDIGFSGEVIDYVSLLAFVGAGNGYISKWYDQSGFGNTIEQTSLIYQPQIVDTGSMITDTNGLYTVDFLPAGDGVHLLFPSGFLNGSTEVSFFGVWNISTSNNDGVFAPSTVNSHGLEVLTVNSISRPTYLRINGTLRNDNAGAVYQMWDDGVPSLTTFLGNSTSVAVNKNGSTVTLTNSSAMPALDFNGQYALGLYFNVGNSMNGKIQEFIIFTSDQTANAGAIETSLISYYGL